MEKAKIDSANCIVCGVCVSLCPDVFYFADDGSIGINDGDASGAIPNCPTSAITQ